MVAKKVVFKVDLKDAKDKLKVMNAISKQKGIESISVDMKDKKVTVIGEVDSIYLVKVLRKRWCTSILSIDLAKEPKKGEEAKTDDKGEKVKSKDDETVAELQEVYKAYDASSSHIPTFFSDDDERSCVIM